MIALDQNILRLQVPVNDPMLVEIKHSVKDLGWVVLNFVEGKFVHFYNDPWKIAPGIISNYDDFLWSFYYIFECNDVGMIDFF